MLKINVITLFPNFLKNYAEMLPLKRAIGADLVEYNLVDLRDFAVDKRGSVDDKPYGGGVGMILRPEPIFDAVESIGGAANKKGSKIILLSPRGQKFTQKKAEEFSKLDEITFICGRYEGVDARIEENLVDEMISIGDYVLSGGELPALAIIEAVVRLLPGVIEKEDAVKIESFSDATGGDLEFPQYTRPEEYKGLKVPEVLLSGNHAEIDKWRKKLISSQPTQKQ